MSTFDYPTPGEAVALAHESARDFEKIIGLKAVHAGYLRPEPSRTRAGNMRKPDPTGREHAQLDKFREIASVAWSRLDGSGEDADPGTVTVTFADGESTYLHAGDLLCVEQPIGPTHEKCADCHLFIEPNASTGDGSDVAPYDHLTRGDEGDESVAGTHDARPSGQRGSLAWWRANGPAEMVARFD